MTTIAKRLGTTGAVLSALLFVAFATGSALAAEGGSTQTNSAETRTDRVTQRVDIPRDNVLAALALGCCTDLSDIANFERSETRSASFSRSSDLDRDDVFLLLALDGRGGFSRSDLFDDDFDDLDDFDDFDDLDRLDRFGRFDRFDRFGSRDIDDFDDLDDLDDLDDFGAIDRDRNDFFTRSIRQSVDIDEDDVLLALALDGGFGDDDFFDIADYDRSVTQTRSSDRSSDLDRDDVLLSLALD